MDVTSMLNNSSVAAEQSPKASEDAKIPLRSRTPWDAGGYSLPINTRPVPLTEVIPYNDSPAKSPRESTHRPSDSHSSISSYASSIHSAQHSRFSSTSTVSGFHPLNNIITDDNGLDRRERCSSRSLRSPLSAVSPCTVTMARNSSSSPAHPLESLAQISERQLSENHQSEATDFPRRGSEMIPARPIMRVEARTKSVSCLHISRPSSPSDAILIKRTSNTTESSVRESSENSESSITPPAQSTTPKLADESSDRLGVQIRGHKRAVSAPDFPGIANELLRRGSKPSTSVGPNTEPTPPSSQHPDHASPGASMLYTAPNTPPEVSGTVHEEEEVPRCMYIADCDTGSQPRKAVSHIFGRNKMCTRLIPKMVWVYYCRKHYQRTRYRNAKEYVKLQYDLVAQQIKRLQDWSQENIRTGQGGVVKDWSIAVRKREQKRLDDQKAKGGFDNDDSGDDEPRGNAATATAVPQWLLDQCGRGYSTAKLMEIVNRLGEELLNGTVSVFPDIEILPNIIVDQEDAEEPKGYAKRKASSSHGRSQSMGAALRSESYPRSRSMSSQPSMTWPPNTAYNQAPLLQKKRKRFDEQEEEYGSPTSQTQRMRVAEYPMDVGRRGPFGHRPTFPNISEHQGYEGEYGHAALHEGYYHQPNTPLPAPTPQRYPSQSMASQLENYGQTRGDLRRPIHKRSQSDMGSIYNPQPAYRFPPRHDEEHLAPPPQQYYDEPQAAPRRYYSPPGFYTNQHPHPHSHPMMQQSLPGHMRHQSTPLLARAYAPHEMSPRFGNHRQPALPPPGHLVMETPQGKMMYSDRR